MVQFEKFLPQGHGIHGATQRFPPCYYVPYVPPWLFVSMNFQTDPLPDVKFVIIAAPSLPVTSGRPISGIPLQNNGDCRHKAKKGH